MVLTFPPDLQPREAPTTAELFARVESLPYALAAFGRWALNGPGVTADALLQFAEGCDQVVAECRMRDVRGILEQDAATWSALAGILRDAAPRYPDPPRRPPAARAGAAPPTVVPWLAPPFADRAS